MSEEYTQPKSACCTKCRFWGLIQNEGQRLAFLAEHRERWPSAEDVESEDWRMCEQDRVGFSHYDYVCDAFRPD